MSEHTPTSPNANPPSRLILRVIGVLIIIISFIWLIFDPGFEPILGFLSALIPILASFSDISAIDKTAPIPEKTQLDNRQKMLQLVQLFWVDGVLKPALTEQEAFTINLKTAAPHLTLKQNDLTETALPSSTKIDEIFYDVAAHNLLILGDPGSGKTILLLQLAEKLIHHAQADELQPIPVVFNLSSWAEKRQPLHEWIKTELITHYRIPQKAAATFIDNEKLLLLLDGLDEVAANHRNACIEAINTFRSIYKSVKLVVCSRIADYEALESRLNLRVAITLQPLTTQHIKPYLAGDHLAGLREILAKDETLQTMTTSPFLLNTMVYAYRDESALNLHLAEHDAQSRRDHLFEQYIARRLTATSKTPSTPPHKTRHYLAWLAGNMENKKESIFFIEDLQPNWLNKYHRYIYRIVMFLSIMLAGCIAGFVVIGLASGLAGGLVVGLMSGIVIGLPGGLAVGIMFGWLYSTREINIVESLQIHLKVSTVVNSIVVGLAIGLIVGIATEWKVSLEVGLGGGLMFALAESLSPVSNTQLRVKPNSGIRQSAINGMVLGFMGWLAVGLIFGLRFSLSVSMVVGLVGGLSVGMLIGLFYGLAATLQHIILRQILYYTGDAPLNYAKFLDYAAERMILQKVGGGYMFIHRYLLEHFANLENKSPTSP